jgi:transposase
MNKKHTHFRLTTSAQRALLFETWQATGSVTEACRKARVSRALFYYWKPRFTEQGLAGVEEFASRAAHKLNTTPEPIVQQVIAMRQEHPDWGKLRISQALAQANGWVPLVTPNTVKRILRDAGLWPGGPKKNVLSPSPAVPNGLDKP